MDARRADALVDLVLGRTTAPGALLCRHHHRLKHRTEWTVERTPDATMIWTSPTGHTYLTYPEGLGPPEAPPGVAATLRLQRLKLPRSPRAA
jgi:hypothetical protein